MAERVAYFAENLNLMKGFELREFATRQDLFDFVQLEGLGSRIAFGFQVIENAANSFELELFFDD